MRQYASGKAGEEAMKIHRQRAANLFLAYATLFEKDYNALQAEHENILAGMDWAYAAKEWEMVRSFASSTDFYLRTRGYWIEDKIRLEQATKAYENLGDKSGVAASLHNLGILAQATGEVAEARRLYGESLKIAQELGDKSGVARSLHQLGILAQNTGEVAEARRLYGESLKIKQELGDKAGVATSIGQLGRVDEVEEDYFSALDRYLLALSILKELNDPRSRIVESWISGLREKMGEVAFKKAFEDIRRRHGA